MVRFPCKGCPDRWVDGSTSCHATCERYTECREQRDRENRETFEKKKRDKEVCDYITDNGIGKRTAKIVNKKQKRSVPIW